MLRKKKGHREALQAANLIGRDDVIFCASTAKRKVYKIAKKAICVVQCSSVQFKLKYNKDLKVVERNFFWKFIAVDAASLTPPYLIRYIHSSYVLFVSFMTPL